MTEEKILSRVRKMLALGNDLAATEGERDNALRMAYNLLAKHQLDMEDVKNFDNKDLIDPRGEFSIEGWNISWCRDVRSAVAKLFMCKYYWQKINATRGKHTFVGREANATTCMYMGDFIVLGLLREADKRYGHRLTPAGRSFGVGAASKLWDRVHAMQADKQAEITSTGSSLVLLDLAASEKLANDEFLAGTGIKLVAAKARPNTALVIGAFRDGRKHADGISLNTQVDNTRTTKALA